MMKRKLLAFLLSAASFSSSAATTFWDGSLFAKLLPSAGIKFSDSKVIRILTVDPTAGSGVSAPIGSLGLRSSSGAGQLWFKNAAADTSWVDILTLASGPTSVSIPASDIDWSLPANVHYKTLSANTTFTFSNNTDGKITTVLLTNTASNYTVAFPATVYWSNGVAPIQTVGAFTDLYTFVQRGSVTIGSALQNINVSSF